MLFQYVVNRVYIQKKMCPKYHLSYTSERIRTYFNVYRYFYSIIAISNKRISKFNKKFIGRWPNKYVQLLIIFIRH